MSLPTIDVQRGAGARAALANARQSLRGRWGQVVEWWRRAARHGWFFPLLLVMLGLAVYLPRLDYPERYLFDEILFAYTAGQYAEGNQDAYRWDHPCSVAQGAERCAELFPESVQEGSRVGRYEWTHPPVSKLIIAGGILVFGNDTFGWRIMSVVAGTAGLLIAYGLGLRLTGRRSVGLLTAALLLLDGMYFVYARMGLVDIFLTAFTMSSLLAFSWFLTSPPERARLPLIATGVLIGLALATKWSAAYGSFFIGVIILWRLVQLWRSSGQSETADETRRAVRRLVLWTPVALGIIPLAIYLLAYLPFFVGGNNGFDDFIELQKAAFDYHAHLQGIPRTASRWWTWPLDLRSVWFGTRNLADGRVAITYALGNPLLYWTILPTVVYSLVRWWRSYNGVASAVLLIGFFGQWLPWALVGRSSYLYHFLPAVPFGCLAVAATIVHLCETRRDWRRTLAIEYVVLVALAFAFFYPIHSHYPISEHALALRMWLSSWA